ncbi:IS1634 family transposase [Anaerobium acetethylicum]|uniref:Transposase DDE domain-containing protein n=1 Tax=Anaerobium acetethylicum TaxID=1619234 RepID=A0A1D3TZI4_9FIRM|nr:transposase [Anaerobium acetethylicum]SCQ00003.1 Transposase DDE domain-containing protein [Anaerobium acetethylicum]
MYYNFLVKIPENTGKISKNKRGNTTYIEYTYGRKYNPDKKYNVPQRTTIGKMSSSDDTKMYPNPNFEKYFPDVALPEENDESSRSSCVRVGSYLVIKKIAEDYQLFDHLDNWDDRGKGLLLDLAAYSIISENNAAQHYPEYAYNHPLMTPEHKIYSDSTISRFLTEISADDRVNFLNSWNEHRNHDERIYISYDSTNKNCKAGDIEKAEYGHPKNDVGAPVFNYSVAYDMNNQIPLLYESYPGSIVDVSQLHYVIEKFQGYGYKNIGFVLDRGYFSKDNIKYMESCNYDYVIMVKGKASFVHQLITDHKGEFELKRSCFIKEYLTYGTTIRAKLYIDDEQDSYFHLYHKTSKENAELMQLETMLQRMENTMEKYKGKEITFGSPYEHYFDLTYHEKAGVRKFYGYKERADIIEKEMQLCGYFTIVTSKKMSAQEALALYKSRDASEKLFCSDKSFLGNHSLRVSGNDALESKIFIEFIALIIRSKIYTLLRKRMAEMSKKPNYMTVPAALRELEKIELIKQPKGHYKLDHAITATQKTILGAFGLDEDTIRAKAIAVGMELAKSAKPEKEEKEEDGSDQNY